MKACAQVTRLTAVPIEVDLAPDSAFAPKLSPVLHFPLVFRMIVYDLRPVKRRDTASDELPVWVIRNRTSN